MLSLDIYLSFSEAESGWSPHPAHKSPYSTKQTRPTEVVEANAGARSLSRESERYHGQKAS